MSLCCAISNETPEHPVVSPSSGCVFERRLLEKYIAENGTDPITGKELSEDMLIELKCNKGSDQNGLIGAPIVKPRPPSATSIPAILKSLQDEWDAVMLHSFTLRQHQYAAEAGGFAEAPLEQAGMTPEVIQKLQDKASVLTQERKKRGKTVPEDLTKPEDIRSFKILGSHPGLHSASVPGILAMDIHAADTSKILTGGNDKNATIFNKDTEQVVAILKGHTKKVTNVIYHPQEDMVFTSSPDASIRVWHVPTSQCIQLIKAHEGPVTGLSLHATGDYLLSTSTDEHWAFSDIRTGTVLTKVADTSSQAALTTAVFHPDGLIFGTGTSDSMIKIWDLKERTNVANFPGHSGPVVAIAFSENGYYLATSADDSTVKLWDLRKLKNFKTITLDDNYEVKDLCFDQSGTYLAIAGTDVRVYLCKQWQELKMFNDHTALATGVRFGRHAHFIASSSMDRTLKIYGMGTPLEILLERLFALLNYIHLKMGKKKQTEEKHRRNVTTSTHRHLLAHKIGHRYHLLISRRGQPPMKNRNEFDQNEQTESKKTSKVSKNQNIQSKIVKSNTSQQYYSKIIKDDVSLHVRRSERLASLERTKMVDNPSTTITEQLETKDDVIQAPSLPELENTINLDHAYSKQLDCRGKLIGSTYDEYQAKNSDKHAGRERKSCGKRRKCYDEDSGHKKTYLTYWSTENENFCDRFADHSRSPSAGSSSSCSSSLSSSKQVFNVKNRKSLIYRKGHSMGSKEEQKSLKRRKSKPKFLKCKNPGEKVWSDDESEAKQRRKVLNVKRGKEVQEVKQVSKSRVDNAERSVLDQRKASSTRRRGRPPKMAVGIGHPWPPGSEQWRKKAKSSSKWAALSHEQQCAAIKGWKYLLQVAFTEIQLKNFWEEVEKEFFKVQVKYIRHQNQNDLQVDEEYLTVLRNTVVWKHLRCHHESILKQLRRRLQELAYRHAEMRNANPNYDRHPTMRKQVELLRCIESILNGGNNDVNLNISINGSRHRVASSKLTEILQTIDEMENVEEVDIMRFDQNDYTMLDDILSKLQRPGSPVTVMPLGGQTVAVPLPLNHELCDSLLREADLACLAPDVVEACLQVPSAATEAVDPFFLRASSFVTWP
uniref:Pre-mRNA-processing factor 19 n=1 Tax=Strigamia maritima TaxID=126957 RepID=T1IPC0_STRMM